MNTHIIIPIKDIDDILEELKDYNDEPELTEKKVYKNLKKLFKQISLSKKDIEEKAHKFVQDTTLYGAKDAPIGSAARSYYETELRSYKQALKDLK